MTGITATLNAEEVDKLELEEKELSPAELTDELERRCFQERQLVIITAGQWQAITDAYHSPMIERMAATALSICPVRTLETRALSFLTYTQKFQPR